MTETNIEIDYFEQLRDSAVKFARLGNHYLVTTVKGEFEPLFSSVNVYRIQGMLILRLRTGHAELDVNFQKFKLTAGNVLVINPGVVFTGVKSFGKKPEWDLVFVNREFMKGLNMDLTSVNIRPLTDAPSPVVQLTKEEAERFNPYIKMLATNAAGETSVFTVKIARALFTAMLYILLDCFFARIVENDGGESINDNQAKARRPTTYVRDFMRLLHLNYLRERSSEFYASRLCISSKYLSIIVKEATGRSVSDWISEFVVMEAKNLLRFSGKSVQQVAYALNFPSQSSFGKYFKRVTGISPTDYQRT